MDLKAVPRRDCVGKEVLIVIGREQQHESAAIFVIEGQMTIDQWKSFAVWLFGAFAASTALHESAIALGGGKPASAPKKEGGAS